jgi:alpha-L-fucosidase
MALSRRSLLAATLFGAAGWETARAGTGEPGPYGALPSERQLRWEDMKFNAFTHFTVNTFTDKEWGSGEENPAIFNPTDFDADAIVEPLQAAGAKGVILTCKHHDGFCLWPTRTTEHCVRNSPWRNGKGDVVREISEAARRHGLKFGVYVSPWDRNSALYGTPQYIELYRKQVRELLTGYGPIFEIWHDGANGGQGYYGGAREKRVIDKHTYYDWPGTWKMERELQPGAVIFSDVGPDVRWVGNEKGIAGETCWETYDPVGVDGGPAAPGDVREKQSTIGTRNGAHWMPAECDVSIRPGWFWHEAENGKVKTAAQLLELYYASVGRGAGFLLNVPPDRRGRLADPDVASLRGFGQLRRAIFEKNLAAGANVRASNVRGKNAKRFGPRNLTDGKQATYWATDDDVHSADIVVDFGGPVTFDVVRLREHIALGQRIERFAIEAWQNGSWSPFASGTSIGACRLLRAAHVTAPRIRVRILESPVCLTLSELGVFAEPGISG